MYRRRLSVLALCSLLVVAGCLGAAAPTEESPEPYPTNTDGATQVPQPNERDPVRYDLPETPDEITAETVGPFAADYEEIRMHDELVASHSNLVSVGTVCEAADVEPGEGSYAVTVECGHWYEFADGDARGIADGAPYAIVYTITEDGQVSHGETDPVF